MKTGVIPSPGAQGRRARTRKVAQGQASRAQGCARISTCTKRAQRRARKDARKVAQGQTSSAKARARTRKLKCSCSRACAMGHPRKPEDSGQSGQIRARTARKVGNRRARKNTERGRARKVAQGQAPSAQGCERASYCKTMHSSAFSGLTLSFRKNAARKDGRARSRKVRARFGQKLFSIKYCIYTRIYTYIYTLGCAIKLPES